MLTVADDEGHPVVRKPKSQQRTHGTCAKAGPYGLIRVFCFLHSHTYLRDAAAHCRYYERRAR